VDKLDYSGLKELYEKHYETPYDGGFTVLKEDAGMLRSFGMVVKGGRSSHKKNSKI